jgi:steroid delta-isomerase-like uncharacterized protein
MSDRQHQEEENEALAHRFHMDIFQKGDLSAADQILATNFVWRNPIVPSELAHGPEGVKKIASAAIDSMPDLKITHDDTISKGDKVIIRWTMTGTVKKDLFGILASDKPATIIGFDLFRIANGRIVEMWQQFRTGTWS